MSDRYTKAVAYLTKHPDKIKESWTYGGCANRPVEKKSKYRKLVESACLFQYAVDHDEKGIPLSAKVKGQPRNSYGGCLTLIRGGRTSVAQTAKLTKEIRADKKIPDSSSGITVKDLPHFAKWQRRLDKELKR